MAGKVIIFGGAGGIGSATARQLAAKGHALHLVGRNMQALAELGAELSASHAVADVTDAEAIRAAVQAAGPELQGLVYAVGTITLKPLARLSAAEMERDFRVNALGAALAVEAAAPALKAGGSPASVVLFSSVAVAQGFGAHVSIGLSKGAVEGLTRALAAEFAPRIRVNAIAPSLTRTALSSNLTDNPQMAAAIAALHPLQRLGEPEDVAMLAAFLIGEEAGWITGQIIGVDGGRARLRTKG